MRVTSQILYQNFNKDHTKVLNELNRLTTQVSSGQKIANSYEDSSVYSDLLRLETQLNDLNQVQERTTQAQTFTDASDSALSEFTQTLRDFQTKLIAANSDALNANNRESIATELEELKNHMITVANTQVNGQYLFSGSAVNIKPIDNDGNYHGNADALTTVVGEGVSIQHNIDGKSLFLGSDLSIHKTVETNVQLKNTNTGEKLTSSDTIADLTGDPSDSVHFYVSGTKPDGTAIKDVINMQSNATIENLLTKIKEDFDDTVTVDMTDEGTIEVKDLKSGLSQLSFQIVGVQKASTDPIEYDLTQNSGGDFIELTQSNFTDTDSTIEDALHPDAFYFQKNGAVLEGNIPLISNGSFANATTTLREIMHVEEGNLPNKLFEMKVTDVNGVSHDVSLDLSASSSFTVDGTAYDIFDADGTTITDGNNFTVAQLGNIIAMTIADELPASNSAADYQSAIVEAKKTIEVTINDNGNLEITDTSDNLSNIEFAMYDSDANDFSNSANPSMSFMSNNAVTTQKANMNFFSDLDDIISAVRSGNTSLNADANEPRNIGIDNAIASLEQMHTHFNNMQAKIGVRSSSLTIANERAASLELNITELKANATEVDVAETIVKLNQVTLNYQAMLQTITKVNGLSLLNYM